MAEYIEREVAQEALKRFCEGMRQDIPRYPNAIILASKDIDEIPAADVVEVVNGQWIETLVSSPDYYGLVFGWKCSECGYHFEDRSKHRKTPRFMKYCPNCGARMDGE